MLYFVTWTIITVYQFTWIILRHCTLRSVNVLALLPNSHSKYSGLFLLIIDTFPSILGLHLSSLFLSSFSFLLPKLYYLQTPCTMVSHYTFPPLSLHSISYVTSSITSKDNRSIYIIWVIQLCCLIIRKIMYFFIQYKLLHTLLEYNWPPKKKNK